MPRATLSFVGDIFLSGDYHALPAAGQRRLFEGLADTLAGSDLVFGNFEGVVLDEEPAGLPPDKIRMAVAPGFLPALRSAGFNVLSLSNNHVFDYGVDAFLASRQRLVAAGFTVFGAGLDDEEALAPVVRRVGDLAVGFIGFTCASTHPAPLDATTHGVGLRQRPDVAARVASARRTCDLLVVSLHWGDEHVAWPSPDQLAFARQLIDAGADVIAGHHAHVVQGVERYRGGVIAYGLGGVSISRLTQRVTWQGVAQDYHFEPRAAHRQSVVMQLTVESGRVMSAQLVPVVIDAAGRPQRSGPATRRGGPRWLWHMPGYALFFRTVHFMQFTFVPRLRWLADGSAWRRLTRRWR